MKKLPNTNMSTLHTTISASVVEEENDSVLIATTQECLYYHQCPHTCTLYVTYMYVYITAGHAYMDIVHVHNFFCKLLSNSCVLMRDERRKEERSKQGQTNNKAKQHSTPKAVTFPKKY